MHPLGVGGTVPFQRERATFLTESLNSLAKNDFNRGGVEHDLPNKIWLSRVAATVPQYVALIPQKPQSTKSVADAMETVAGISYMAMAMNKNLPQNQQFIWKNYDQWLAWREVWIEFQKLGLGPPLSFNYEPFIHDDAQSVEVLPQRCIEWGQVIHEIRPHMADLSMDISSQSYFAQLALTSFRGETKQFVRYIDRLLESGILKWSYWVGGLRDIVLQG
jgi:hypothetical protein